MITPLRIGTRGSQLALWQANHVKASITRLFPGTAVELTIIKTTGDKIQDVPLAKVGGKGLFVKEIEDALIAGHIDLAVHSMKDMPAALPDGLVIGAVPEREDPRDALITRIAATFRDLPEAARIGTSSLRRGAQLRAVRPDVVIVPLRGNLDTRLRKLETENLDAVILAVAGMKRMGFASRITESLSPDLMLPAVGQGALCIETRADDPRMAPVIAELDHPVTRTAVTAERALLARLEGGCQVPIAGHATLDGSRLILKGRVASLDGATLIAAEIAGPGSDAARLGLALAGQLLSQGASAILSELKAQAL